MALRSTNLATMTTATTQVLMMLVVVVVKPLEGFGLVSMALPLQLREKALEFVAPAAMRPARPCSAHTARQDGFVGRRRALARVMMPTTVTMMVVVAAARFRRAWDWLMTR